MSGWGKPLRRPDRWLVLQEPDPGNGRLLTLSLVLGMYVLCPAPPTVSTVGASSKDTDYREHCVAETSVGNTGLRPGKASVETVKILGGRVDTYSS